MNAADEIQAAIDKLTDLNGKVHPDYMGVVNENCSWYTTELVVALHRTIDVQLAILRNNYQQVKDGYSPDEPGAVADALKLARSINGATS